MRFSHVLAYPAQDFAAGYRFQTRSAEHPQYLFFDGKSRCHVQSARSTQVSGGEARALTLNIPPCSLPKKKEKAINEVSTIAPGQNTLHLGAAVTV